VGVLHLPPTQFCEAQSLSAEQSFMYPHDAAQP
jgi:hypothetical protein